MFSLEGVQLYNSGNFQKAIEISSRGYHLLHKGGKASATLSDIAYNLGYYLYESDSLEKSYRYFLSSAKIQTSPQLRSQTYKAASDIAFLLADFSAGAECASLGIESVKHTSHYQELADCYNSEGRNYHGLGQLTKAAESYKKALHYSGKQKDANPDLDGALHLNIGNNEAALGHHAVAISHYLTACTVFQKMKDNERLIKSLGNVAYEYQHGIKNFQVAETYYTKAIDLIKRYFNEKSGHSFPRVYGNYGLLKAQIADEKTSVEYFEKAIKSFPGLDSNNPVNLKYVSDKMALWEILSDYGYSSMHYYLRKKRNLLKALSLFEQADLLIDYMRWEHSGNVTKLFWREQTKSMYEHAIETCYLLNDHTKAFHFFEKSRAVMLNDQLNELGAKQLLSEEDQKKESLLSRKVSDMQNKLAETGADEKAVADIRSRLFLAQQEQENFIKKLETSNAQYYAYKYDNAVPTLAELRNEILKDKQTLVSYFVGDSAVYGLAIGAEKTDFQKIDLKKYAQLTPQFQKIIGDREAQNRRFKDYLTLSFQLYDLLLKPFAIPPGTRIVVSPDGDFLPFGAFSASRDRADYLVSRYAFSYTYSAGFLAKSRKNRKSGILSKSFLGIAPVQFAPSLAQADLAGSDQVLKTINRHFFLSETLIGAEASRNAFAKNAPDYRIVQLFTHATADSSGRTPTLYFADSTLKVNELLTDRTSSTELLVLSACRTGTGKNQRGEGVFSLARGFAGLGIPSTVTTLWDVENEAIYGLTSFFYQELANELPLDIALQRTQNQWLNKATSADQLPYAWAGMVLVGSTEHVSPGISRSEGFVLLIASIVLAVFLIYHFRKRQTGNQ